MVSVTNAELKNQRATFWLFRGATYVVLLCGFSVFATIVFKGAGSLVKRDFPFVNTAFFTEAPESLLRRRPMNIVLYSTR